MNAPPVTRPLLKPSRAEMIALAAVLALAALLRVGWPSITEFKADEARLLGLALDLAEFKSLPWCGIGSSVGVPNSPVSVYLTAYPLLVPFNRNPIRGALWVGALNTLAVFGCYWLGRRYWGSGAGLVAALLFATAPWAVIFARKIWAQDYLPLFTICYIGSALLAVVEGRRAWIAVHLALLPIIIQIHLSGIVFIPLTALIVGLFWRKLDWRWVGVGVGLAGLASLPFFGCFSARYALSLPHLLSELPPLPPVVNLDSVRWAWSVITGAETRPLAGPQAYQQFLASIPDYAPLRWLVGGLVLGGLAYWAAQAARRRAEPGAQAGLICILWVLLPPIFFLRHTTGIFPHYFITLFPGPHLAAGALAGAVWRWRRAWPARALAAGVLALIAVAQAAYFLSLLNFVTTHDTGSGFGFPAGMQLSIVRQAEHRLSEMGLDEIIVVSRGDEPAKDEFPAIFHLWLRDLPHRFVDGRTTALLPADGAVVLIMPEELQVESQYLEWAADDPQMETFSLAGGARAFTLLVVPPNRSAAPPHPADPPAQLANGAVIVGYDWEGQPEPGGRVAWRLWWQVGRLQPAPEGNAYHIFNHLVDEAGDRWGQQDARPLPPNGWQVGDLAVSYFDLEIAGDAPPGPYWVRSGMYTYPDLGGVPVLDVAGNPAGDWVRLGPLAAP